MVKWSNEKNPLWLFTPEEYNKLPDGTVLECIDKKFYTKGVDTIDLDIRFGYIAFGIRDPLNHPLAELFTVFKLEGL